MAAGALALFAELAGPLVVLRGDGFNIRAQVLDIGVVVAERVQLLLQGAVQRQQFPGLDVVFAGDVVNRAQALFHGEQAFRVQFEAVDMMLQGAAGFLGLDQRAVEQFPGLLEGAGFGGDIGQGAQGLVEDRGHIEFAVAAQGHRMLAGLQGLLAAGQLGLFLFQGVQLAFLERQLIQFVDLVAQ